MNRIRLWVLVMVTLGILTGCDGCDDGFGPQMVRYTGMSDNGTYQLEITENLNRAIYAPATGDNYKLTLLPSNKISTGTITVSGTSITLTPDKAGTTGTIGITISGSGISAITVTGGTVQWNGDTSAITAVATLTPVGSSGFEGIWAGTITNQENTSLTAHYTIVAASGKWSGYQDGEFLDKGTYTVSGNTVNMAITQEYVNNAWQNQTGTATGTISGNRFTFTSGFTASIFTRQL